ncbi:MAG: hypothetical protein CVT92_14455 [Bacteroidetes bacterium HGW-Bacteroidetes-1]|nr:MAG: hypothetical protein CVT92_14455 [Bacteroidetes bacterium HGW-Bacteroidetes-1]
MALCAIAVSQSYTKNHRVAQRDNGFRINKNNPLHIKKRLAKITAVSLYVGLSNTASGSAFVAIFAKLFNLHTQIYL